MNSGPLSERMVTPPPPELGGAHVLEYAMVDETVRFTGRLHLYVGETRLGSVPRLALGEDLKTGEIMLLHCDDDWEIIAIQPLGKIEADRTAALAAARERVEEYYEGISRLWVEHGSSSDEAVSCDQIGQCSFCLRCVHDFESAIEGPGGVRICNICLREATETLEMKN